MDTCANVSATSAGIRTRITIALSVRLNITLPKHQHIFIYVYVAKLLQCYYVNVLCKCHINFGIIKLVTLSLMFSLLFIYIVWMYIYTFDLESFSIYKYFVKICPFIKKIMCTISLNISITETFRQHS